MSDEDKRDLLENLKSNFVKMGAPESLANDAATTGSVPMYMFLSKWICHNTEYPQDRRLDNSRFMKSMFAWIYYKSTAKEFKPEEQNVKNG